MLIETGLNLLSAVDCPIVTGALSAGNAVVIDADPRGQLQVTTSCHGAPQLADRAVASGAEVLFTARSFTLLKTRYGLATITHARTRLAGVGRGRVAEVSLTRWLHGQGYNAWVAQDNRGVDVIALDPEGSRVCFIECRMSTQRDKPRPLRRDANMVREWQHVTSAEFHEVVFDSIPKAAGDVPGCGLCFTWDKGELSTTGHSVLTVFPAKPGWQRILSRRRKAEARALTARRLA
jgi:hypothetical protein